MTNIAPSTQPKPDGLPTLELSKKATKKPPLVIAIVIILFLCVVAVAVQVFISSQQWFDTSPITVEEPPLPGRGSPSVAFDIDHVPGVLAIPTVESNSENTDSHDDRQCALNDQLLTEITLLKKQLDWQTRLKNIQQQFKHQHQQLLPKVSESVMPLTQETQQMVLRIEDLTQAVESLRQQLSSFGVYLSADAQAQSLHFPMVIFGKTVWGKEVYLTVAPSENPTETQRLFLGDHVAQWQLIRIFQHTTNHKKKEVNFG